MPDPRVIARSLGVTVEIADLGAWSPATLVAEYDPAGPVIRLNARALAVAPDAAALADHAVAHELYHHREAVGAVERLPTRRARETAADAYARALLGTRP